MPEASSIPKDGTLFHWLERLPKIMIAIVVLCHIGGVFNAAGMRGWVWIVADPWSIEWAGIVSIVFGDSMMATSRTLLEDLAALMTKEAGRRGIDVLFPLAGAFRLQAEEASK